MLSHVITRQTQFWHLYLEYQHYYNMHAFNICCHTVGLILTLVSWYFFCKYIHCNISIVLKLWPGPKKFRRVNNQFQTYFKFNIKHISNIIVALLVWIRQLDSHLTWLITEAKKSKLMSHLMIRCMMSLCLVKTTITIKIGLKNTNALHLYYNKSMMTWGQ